MSIEQSVDALLETAQEAVKAGSQVLVKEHEHFFGDDQRAMGVAMKTSPIDLVTNADSQSQEAIIQVIQQKFPDHRILAEEEGADSIGDPESPYRWIIDPLDGTFNFVHGKPNCGPIVCVEENGTLLAGAMELPLMDQRFHGARGMGAFYNDKPVMLRKTKGLSDAILCTNTIRRAQEREDGVWAMTMPFCGSIENYGCAAEEFGEILRGYNDGAFFNGTRLWDVSVGVLLIEEAGGKAAYEFEDPEDHRSGLYCVASTEEIYDELYDFTIKKKLV